MDLNSKLQATQNQSRQDEQNDSNDENSPVQNDEVFSNDDLFENIEDDESTDWERTNVESIKEVRDAQIETKMFEMHKENNQMTSTLVSKEKQLQKQVRGITSECGKLRLEVGWLERDLSQVKENGRRQVLETQAALQIQRLRIEEDTRDKVKEAKFLQKKLDQQRDEITQKLLVAHSKKSGVTSDLDAQIALLSEELEGITSKIVNAGSRFIEPSSEARRTTFMLQDQLRAIELRESSLNDSIEKERKHLEDLHLKLEKAEKESESVKLEIQRLTEERTQLRKKMEQDDVSTWINRISNLSCEQLENALSTDIDDGNEDVNLEFHFDPETKSGFFIDINAA